MVKKMGKQNTRLIEALVLAIIVGSFYIAVQPLNEAWALTRPITATGFNNVLFTKYVPSTSGTNYITTGNFSSYIMKTYNANSSALINTFSVKTVTPSAYAPVNVSCDKTAKSQLCAVGYESGSSNSGVFLYNPATATVSVNATRYTIASGLFPVVSLFNDGTLTHVYVQYDDGATTWVDTLAMNTTGSLSATSNRLVLIQHLASNVRFTGAFNQDTLSVSSGTNAGNWIMYMNTGSVQLWSISQAKRVCGFNLGAGNVGDIDGVIDSTGTYFLVSNQVSTLYQIDLTCSQLLATNYSAQLTNIYSISHSTSRKEVYIVGDTNKLIVLNETTLSSSPLATYSGITSPAIHFNNLATGDAYPNISTTNGFVVIGGGGNPANLYWFYWNGQGTGNGGASGACNVTQLGIGQFCNSSGQTCINVYDSTGNVLITTYCSTSQSGGKVTTPNTISSITTGANLTTMGNTFGCGLGITSCTNTNIQTNGVGLFFLLLLIIFSYAMLVAIHYKVADKVGHDSGGTVQITQVMNVNPMLLTIMLIADVGIAFYVNWINGIPFYTMVVGIVGFLTFGIYRHIKGESS